MSDCQSNRQWIWLWLFQGLTHPSHLDMKMMKKKKYIDQLQ